jgi:chromatin segregation and condensation protein Rec8/ScpA/Scc1 (kleisin family)
MDLEAEKQKTLMEFFELIEKPTWQATLQALLKKYSFDVWNIDVSELLEKLLHDAYEKENLKNASLIILICTILLKSKARRIGLRELEQNIKEELEELENLKENDELTNVSENPEILEKYNELLELERKLKNMFYRIDNKTSDKKKKEFNYIIKIESYFQLKLKIFDFFKDKESITYSQLKENVKTNNSLIMSLLLLNNENKVKLKQKEPYGEIIIKKVD